MKLLGKISLFNGLSQAVLFSSGFMYCAVAHAETQPFHYDGRQYTYVESQPASPAPVNTSNNGGFGNLSAYPYDPRLDPQKPPYVTPKARDPRSSNKVITLGTPTSMELGLQLSSYRYQEHVIESQDFMHIDGPTFGITFDGAKSYPSGFFWGGDLRFAYGRHDYTGGDVNTLTGVVTPATHDGEDDVLLETRLIGGHDFIFDNAFNENINFSIAPYAGLGFRYLYNDARGEDSNGVEGYERTSHYIYIPVGITPRFRVTDMSRISLNMEYDQLLYGYQVSFLGDSVPGATDINNTQETGYGLRGSLMYEWPKWSMGPFFNYWNIGRSKVACDNLFCGDEPHNYTVEYGLQGKYRF